MLALVDSRCVISDERCLSSFGHLEMPIQARHCCRLPATPLVVLQFMFYYAAKALPTIVKKTYLLYTAMEVEDYLFIATPNWFTVAVQNGVAESWIGSAYSLFRRIRNIQWFWTAVINVFLAVGEWWKRCCLNSESNISYRYQHRLILTPNKPNAGHCTDDMQFILI